MYLFIWLAASSLAGPLAYHVRVEAGQPRTLAFWQAILTAAFPWLLFQDLYHARRWKQQFGEHKNDVE